MTYRPHSIVSHLSCRPHSIVSHSTLRPPSTINHSTQRPPLTLSHSICRPPSTVSHSACRPPSVVCHLARRPQTTHSLIFCCYACIQFTRLHFVFGSFAYIRLLSLHSAITIISTLSFYAYIQLVCSYSTVILVFSLYACIRYHTYKLQYAFTWQYETILPDATSDSTLSIRLSLMLTTNPFPKYINK